MESLRERFGKYHVLARIAQGGMAEVYKVKTVGIAGFEKVQALKRILPAQARSLRFIRSFIDEARIAVELNHRNIVQVFDFGKADGELYLAMELIEGKDLRTATAQAAARGVALAPGLACHIIAEVAAGLDFAHRKADELGRPLGIVHCDVSPANVMLSSDGYVKILDFGVARASFASDVEQRRLRGKPRYMAPEQTHGEPPTPASDVFALGIVAWELLAGRVLFDGADVPAILRAVRQAEVPRLDAIREGVPREVAAAVARALDVVPARRGSAADLAASVVRAAVGTGARALAAWIEEIDRHAPRGGESDTALEARIDQTSQTGHGVPRPIEQTAETMAGLAVPAEVDVAPVPRAIGPAPTRSLRRASSPKVRAPSVHGVDEDGVDDAYDAVVLEMEDEEPSTFVGGSAGGEPDEDSAAPVLAEDPASDAAELGLAVADAVGDAAFDAAFAPATEADDDAAADDLAAVLAGPAPAAVDDEAIDDDLGAPVPGGLPERRRAVVVAVVVDSPDDPRPLVIALGDLAYKRGGVVVDVDEGGAVVAFGMEIAGEDDVATAMAYAVDAAAATRDLDAAATVRVGGRAGVIAPVGADAGGRRIPADAIEEARQLARDAQPGRPLFAGGAGRVTAAHFAFRELPARRHLHHRGRLLEVIGPRSFDERGRALLDRRGRFVGRSDALARLDAIAARAAAGEHRMSVLVRGRVGTGKSRLVAEFAARALASTPPPLLVAAQALPSAHLAPFALVVDVFHAALDLPPGRGRAARARLTQRLRHVLAKGGISAATAAQVSGSLDRAMALRDGAALAPTLAADLRDQVAVAQATFRTALRAAGRPLVTVVEDLHLADGASLEVLRQALTMPTPGAEILIATARPDATALPDFDEVITVDDLAGADLDELIADRLGPAATPDAVAAVIQRAGGNPLFVEEVAAAIREAGVDVPATARDVLAARIDWLAPAAKTLLQYAAVLAGALRARLLDELVPGDLPAALEELTAEGLLVRIDHAAPEAAEGELAFARGLVREVVLEALPARAQREAHARIGALLASRFHAGRDEPPAVIAEHLERGGALAGAAAFWLRAGRSALGAGGSDAALAHFGRTLALEAQLGADRPTTPSRARRRAALTGRDEARRLQGDLVDDGGDLDELARLADGNPARLADVELRRADRLVRAGLPSAMAALDCAAALARRSRDERARGETLRLRGEALALRGRFPEARAALAEARGIFRRLGALSEDTAAMIGDAHALTAQGRVDEAADVYAAIAARLGDRGLASLERVVPGLLAEIELARGDLPAALAAARRGVELSRRHGDRAREGQGLVQCGAILDELGAHDEAAACLADGLALLERAGARHARAAGLVRDGINRQRRGDRGAIAALDEALAQAGELSAHAVAIEALLARADAYIARAPVTELGLVTIGPITRPLDGADTTARATGPMAILTGEAITDPMTDGVVEAIAPEPTAATQRPADAALPGIGAIVADRTAVSNLEAAIADATAAAQAAAAIASVGAEMRALARRAEALRRLGRAIDAHAPSARAVALLARQPASATVAAEVLAVHARVLAALGEDAPATAAWSRAAALVRDALESIDDAVWQATFAAMPLHRALLG